MGLNVGAINQGTKSVGYGIGAKGLPGQVGYPPKPGNEQLLARLDSIDARVQRPDYSGSHLAQNIDYLSW